MAYELASANSQYLSAINPVLSAPFTISCWGWINGTSVNVNHALVSLNQNSGTNRFVLYVGNPGVLYFFINSSSGFSQVAASGTISTNTWFHACAIEASSSDHRVFLNSNKSTNTTTQTPVSINAMNMGTDRNNNVNTSLLNGRLADIAVWNVALTDQEVASLAKGMTCDKVRPQNLVFYAPLVRNLQDVKNGFAIVNNNSATVATHPRVYA